VTFLFLLLFNEKRDSSFPSGLWIVLFWLPAETLSLKRLRGILVRSVLPPSLSLIYVRTLPWGFSCREEKVQVERCMPLFTWPLIILTQSYVILLEVLLKPGSPYSFGGTPKARQPLLQISERLSFYPPF